MTVEETAQRDVEAVVIGASSGGIDALTQLLPSFQRMSAIVVFLVLHLPRERPSLLVDLVARYCALRVREPQDKEPVRRGTLYVAPPDYHLLVEAGPSIALSVDDPVNFSRPSIDALFESAADVYADRLLGVILSGANDDGAAGLAAVEARGGMAYVQDPSEAGCAVMIDAALLRVPGAEVLALSEMGRRLAALDGGVVLQPGR